MNTHKTSTESFMAKLGSTKVMVAVIVACMVILSTLAALHFSASFRHSQIQAMSSEQLNSIPAPNKSGEQGQPILPAAPKPQRPSGEDPIKMTVQTASGTYTAPIDSMCLTDGNGNCDDKSGTFHPPTDVARLGWWNLSAHPGDTDNGSIVIAGHVDFGGQTGFAALVQTLKEGDMITLTTGRGFEHKYRVSGPSNLITKNLGKDKYLEATRDTINKKDGQDFITFVSCGGKFVGGMLGYESNEVVTAYPVE